MAENSPLKTAPALAEPIEVDQAGPLPDSLGQHIDVLPAAPIEESAASIMARLVFNWDGTISADQLEGVPAEMVERITTPEFVAMAKAQIAKARGIVKTGRRELRAERKLVGFLPNGVGPNRRQRRLMAAGFK